jgi:hypothetical protein
MGTKFTYALILTITGAVLQLLLYFTGYQTEKLDLGEKLSLLSVPLSIAIICLGIKAVREESPGKYMSYGKGVGSGVLITLFSGLMSAVYQFIHLKFVNTEYLDYKMQQIQAQWEKAGMSAAQMEQAESVTRAMMGPVGSSIFVFFMTLLFGLIVSLIAAAFLKRPAPETAAA